MLATLTPAALRKHLPDFATGTRPAACAWVQPYDSGLSDSAGQAAQAVGAGGFFSSLGSDTNTRILATSQPYSADDALAFVEARRRAADPNEDWRYTGLGGYKIGLDQMLAEGDLRDLNYYLLTWPGRRRSVDGIFHSAAANFGTPVVPCDLPPLFGNYIDKGSYLAPADGVGPLLAIYSAYELIGGWSPATIHRVLQLPFPVLLAIDVQNSGSQAGRQLETAYNTLSSQLSSQLKIGAVDPRAEAALQDVLHAQRALEEDQTLHQIRIVLAIQAPDLEMLAQARTELEGELNMIMKLRPEPGQGAEWLKWFSPAPRRAIKAQPAVLPALSAGVGVLMPFGYSTGQGTDGLLLGFDLLSRSPIFHDLWARAEEITAHLLAVGKAGSGKTFLLECLLYRAAVVLDTQIFVFDAIGNFIGLPYMLGNGASINRIKLGGMTLNLLDRVFDDLNDQVQFVARQLRKLLSCGTDDDDVARQFTTIERSTLNKALTLLYKPTWANPAAPARLLGDLCQLLRTLPGPGGDLADEIYGLFVDPDSALSAVFNRPTNIDLQFPRQAYIFDVSEMDESYAPIFYAQLIVVLDRYFRLAPRTKPAIVCIDEFKLAAKQPFVAQLVVDLTKIGRNLAVGVWTSDQDISSYHMTKQAEQVLVNLGVVFIGRQEGKDAEDVRRAFPLLTESHARRLLNARTGQWVVIADSQFHAVQFVPTPVERLAFGGRRQDRRRKQRALDHPTTHLTLPA